MSGRGEENGDFWCAKMIYDDGLGSKYFGCCRTGIGIRVVVRKENGFVAEG